VHGIMGLFATLSIGTQHISIMLSVVSPRHNWLRFLPVQEGTTSFGRKTFGRKAFGERTSSIKRPNDSHIYFRRQNVVRPNCVFDEKSRNRRDGFESYHSVSETSDLTSSYAFRISSLSIDVDMLC